MIILIISHIFLIVEMMAKFESSGHFVLQKNVQTLQSAVDSLQKEKEELVWALQSAKKDTNQAKYEYSEFFVCGLVVSVVMFLPNYKANLF